MRRIFSPRSPSEKQFFSIRFALWTITELAASTIVRVER